MFYLLKDKEGLTIFVKDPLSGVEVLPLATIPNPRPRYATDNLGYTYLRQVSGIPLRSLLPAPSSPCFETHQFRGPNGDFYAISLRRQANLCFISEPWEIRTAIRELDLQLIT